MIGSIYCKFDRAVRDSTGNVIVSFIVPSAKSLPTMALLKKLGDMHIRLNVDEDKPRRSLSANSYFHVLVEKIAQAMKLGMDEVKYKMVVDYGTPIMDGEELYTIRTPHGSDPRSAYPYCSWTNSDETHDWYILYKQTSDLDSTEMSRLLEGTIHEAHELGIETLKDIELKAMTNKWEAKNE